MIEENMEGVEELRVEERKKKRLRKIRKKWKSSRLVDY